MTVTISSLASASVMAENTALTTRSAAALDSDACVATWVASSDFVIDRFLEIAVGYGVPADDAVSFALHWEFVILSFVIVFATRKLAPTKGTASVTAMSIQDQINMAAPGGHSQCNFLAVPIRNFDGGGDLRSPHATSAAPTMPLPRPPGAARRGHRGEVYGLPEQPCIDRDRFGGDATYPNMRSAVAMALAYLIDPDTPKNDGTFRPLEVIAREGTVVWAREGAPVTLATNHCAQEIMEAIMRALAPACPGRVMAGWGRRFRIAIQGTDPRTGRSFIWHMFHARPGGGASSAGDGWPAGGEWQAAGGIKFGSVEVAEEHFPLFFRSHELRPDSGGDGRFRGGPGCEMELVLETEGPAVGNTAGDGVKYPACGMNGGKDALPHLYILRSRGRRTRELKTKEAGIELRPGDVIHVRSGGGGGWGDPGERSAVARQRDLRDGFVTGSSSTDDAGGGNGTSGGAQ